MCYPKHCSLKCTHKRRTNFQGPPSPYWPTASHLPFLSFSEWQKEWNQNLIHLASKITEFYQISDVKGETVYLYSEHKKKNDLLAFSDWKFESYWQFNLLCFLTMPFHAGQTQAMYLVPAVEWLSIILIKFIAKERVSWNS